MDHRGIEKELSRLDRAIQHFAEYVVNGHICIYEHDLPVRSIIVSHNGVFKRIEIAPDPDRTGFVQNIDAWIDSESGRKSWVDQRQSLPPLPEEYADQMNLLHRLWSRVEAISSTDLTVA
jgi:hypothetical protein